MNLNPTEPIKDPRSHPQQAEIIEAIKAGEKYLWIQNEYGCSQVMIAYQKRKLGMEMRKRNLIKVKVKY